MVYRLRFHFFSIACLKHSQMITLKLIQRESLFENLKSFLPHWFAKFENAIWI